MFRSINSKILSSQLLVVFISTIAFWSTIYFVLGASLNSIQREKIEFVAQTWSQKTADFIASRQNLVTEIGKSKVLEAYSHQFGEGFLRQYLSGYSDQLPIISYFGKNGNEDIRIAYGRLEKTRASKPAIIDQARATPNVPTTHFVTSSKRNDTDDDMAPPYIEIAIYNEIFGEFAGIILARLPIRNSVAELAELADFNFGSTGFLSLYNKQGITLLHKNQDNILKKINLPKIFSGPVLHHKDQIGFRLDSNHGIEGYTAYKSVPGSDFILAATMPYDQYQEIPEKLIKIFFFIGLLIALVCFLLSNFITKSIAKPLVSLTDAVTHLSKGKWDHQLEINASGEVGKLAHSFHEMSDDLQEMILSRDNEINLRKRVEQAIKVSHLELDQIFNTTAGGMLVIDLSHEIIRVNDTFLSLFGYTRQDVIGKKCIDLFPKGSCGTEQCTINKVLETDSIVEEEVEEKRKDGSTILCNLVAVPFYGAKGDLVGVIEDFRDITLTKRAEKLVKLSEERFRLLFNSAPDSISVLNSQGVIIDCNHSASKIYGLPRTKLIGRHFTRFNTPESAKFCNNYFEHIQKTNQAEGEAKIILPDGTEATLWRKGTTILDKDGNFEGVLIYDRDVSKQKEVEAIREDMSRIAQHDLKSPLNGIINLPTLIKMDKNLTETQNKRLDLIVTAGYSMLNMINNSLDLYKMEQGTYRFIPVEVDIHTIIKKISAELWNIMQSSLKQIDIIVNSSGEDTQPSFLVLGDELLCYSMLANLVKNAVEASPKLSIVTISLNYNNGAEIRIHNSGQVLPEIYDSFFMKYTTEGKQGGTGLGTYSARLMARTQNGDVTMASSRREGTTLIVKMPSPDYPSPVYISSSPLGANESNKVENPAYDPVSSPSPKTKQRPEKSYQILMAEDDPINQALATALLQEKYSIKVTTVDNGKKALMALENNHFDLVLMDMQMPEMDGLEATKKIRQSEESTGKRTPIVAMTGLSGINESRRFFEAGIDAFIAKPIQIDLLWETIEKLLQIES